MATASGIEGGQCAQVVDAVLRSRRSVRAFRPDAVSRALVREILEVAASAPSNSNTQPWGVHVLTGNIIAKLGADLAEALRRNELPPSAHFPAVLPTPCAARQDDFGARYYTALGIDRADAPARAQQTARNFTFFGAPVGLILTIDARLMPHSWLDCGLFLQNLMIAARARGLDTCPQVSFARFHPVIARHLDLAPDEVTLCGVSLGYADTEAAVNRLEMPRAQAQEFARFIGFE